MLENRNNTIEKCENYWRRKPFSIELVAISWIVHLQLNSYRKMRMYQLCGWEGGGELNGKLVFGQWKFTIEWNEYNIKLTC